MGLPGLFSKTILSRSVELKPSLFIKSMHPKTQIRPDRASVAKVLALGWWGQKKVHGHRAQIHLGPKAEEQVLAYTRKGLLHTRPLPMGIVNELYRLFSPEDSWIAIDCEWVKPEEKLYLFDVLKWGGRTLSHLTYSERYELLPKVFKSESIETLPIYKTLSSCMSVLEGSCERVEGLVFKAPDTKGFFDTSIVRCRK